MARPRHAISATRKRWDRERAIGVMKKRIVSALKRTLCVNHYFMLNDDIFEGELAEVASITNNSPNRAEEAVFPFFLDEPNVIAEELVQEFSNWLKSGRGKLCATRGFDGANF